MPRLWRVLAAAGGCVVVSILPAWAQADADFTLIRDWTPVGRVESRAASDTLLLSSGSIHTAGYYSDLVFRFDFRAPSPKAGGALLLRIHQGEDGSPREYAVALGGAGDSGQLSAQGMTLNETSFTPRPSAASAWTSCEVRLEEGRLTVSLDGAVVATADRLETAKGRIGFRAGAGGLELRGMRVTAPAPPAKPVPMYQGVPSVNVLGIEPPTLTKHVGPIYPQKARDAGISGTVLLEVLVLADGGVGDIKVTQTPHPDLIKPAVACVRKWRFNPARKDGVPVPLTVTVEVAFNLKR